MRGALLSGPTLEDPIHFPRGALLPPTEFARVSFGGFGGGTVDSGGGRRGALGGGDGFGGDVLGGDVFGGDDFGADDFGGLVVRGSTSVLSSACCESAPSEVTG